ncbi:MAG TPA: hypothetical protein VF530_10895 [Planctomycetota bacterium]
MAGPGATPSELWRPGDGLFLVPLEELTPAGIAPAFAARLVAAELVSPAWIERFDAAFALHQRRARELAARAPRSFLPPRRANVCVARDPRRVRPFFQPLGAASWLVDQGLFEPAGGSLELAAYQFSLAERLGLARAVVPALQQDLAYFLALSPAEREDFRAGCRRAEEGRAAGWRALARALEWLPQAHHEELRPPTVAQDLVRVPGTRLLVPRRHADELATLERDWRAAAGERVSAFHAAHAAPGDAGELCAWLAEARPLVLVSGKGGEILWDPEHPAELARVRAALAGLSAAAAERIRGDLEVVGARSRAFLDSLVEPDALPRPGPEIDQDGLAYMHRERRLVAYGLAEPGMERLREPSVPFERWMLAARTIHEWGHLAVDAGLVPVPAERQAEFRAVQEELAGLLDAIVAASPPGLRALAAGELARLAQAHGSPGRALVAQCLGRMSDWQANLLAQRYLAPPERETYVRNNVRPLLLELGPAQLFQALARHAFEFQYLCFDPARDARAYFLACTWFPEQFLARGVLDEARLDALLDLVGRLCRCHEVDPARLR